MLGLNSLQHLLVAGMHGCTFASACLGVERRPWGTSAWERYRYYKKLATVSVVYTSCCTCMIYTYLIVFHDVNGEHLIEERWTN